MEKTLTWDQVDRVVNIVKADDGVKEAQSLVLEARASGLDEDWYEKILETHVKFRNALYQKSDEEVKEYFRRTRPDVDEVFATKSP